MDAEAVRDSLDAVAGYLMATDQRCRHLEQSISVASGLLAALAEDAVVHPPTHESTGDDQPHMTEHIERCATGVLADVARIQDTAYDSLVPMTTKVVQITAKIRRLAQSLESRRRQTNDTARMHTARHERELALIRSGFDSRDWSEQCSLGWSAICAKWTADQSSEQRNLCRHLSQLLLEAARGTDVGHTALRENIRNELRLAR